MGRPSRIWNVILGVIAVTTACTASPVDPAAQFFSSSTGVASVSRTDLGTLGGAQSFATDVNDFGIVVGWSQTAAGPQHAFRWTASQGMIDLGTLPGDEWSRAISITGSGQILGVSGGANDFDGTPVLWRTSGTAASLPIPLVGGATFMMLGDRNASGRVTGSALGGNLISHAWVWSRDQGTVDITAQIPGAFESYGNGINSSGLAVGTNKARTCTAPRAECWHAFLWSPSSGYRDIGLPAGADSTGTQVTGSGLNDSGLVVGWTSADGGIRLQPYRWTPGTGFTVLPTLSPDPDAYGYAVAVNRRGAAVGASEDAFGTIQAAAWPPSGGILRLSAEDPNPSVAVAVNVRGAVVGWATLDCCGGAIHATLWRVGPGRGDATAAVALSPARGLMTARAGAAAHPGPAQCMVDRRAVLSRQRLIDCVARTTRRD